MRETVQILSELEEELDEKGNECFARAKRYESTTLAYQLAFTHAEAYWESARIIAHRRRVLVGLAS